MGITHADIRLANDARDDLEEIGVFAVVDTGALVPGNQVLLGAIPIEDMDLIIETAKLRVSENPLSQNIPLSLDKGLQ